MDAFQRVSLRIVPSKSVRPHEVADPVREARIEQRLRSDGILRDPLVVGEVRDVDGLVLLDGTNRQRALAALNLPALLVQVIDYADEHALELRTWCHATSVTLDDILRQSENIPGLELTPIPALEASAALRSTETLAVILNGETQYAARRVAGCADSRDGQLRRFVDIYEHLMTRVDCSPDEVEERSRTLDASRPTLVSFPPFSRSQVLTMAMRAALIPAGVTRHVILAGRALRVNVPLSMLSNIPDSRSADRELQRHVGNLQPRLYREPTILFDS